MGLATHAEQPHFVVGERNCLERSRHLQAANDCSGDLDFRRNDDVDRQVLTRKQVRPRGIEVTLLAHAGDLDRHLEQRMRHLACHHVDFVGLRHGDDHVHVGDAGAL
jgi:hypothetical protein